jgi:hypothetical protein
MGIELLSLITGGGDLMSSVWGWKYKGTQDRIKVGDRVEMSARYAREFEQFGEVVGLGGFITVQFSNGAKVDFDARNIKGKIGGE